ncbi:MAG: diguanylate cyclase, partial [Armatimonadetes bacterium]|nr:diguanylate cyclase [Armatimonadota bacterium]
VLRRERPFSQLEQGLAASIAHTVASAMDNARAHQKVLSLAQLDPVTGVLNPRTMHDRLARALADRRPEDSLALLLLDLVNFRQVNAIHGLPAGDAILRRAAQLLTVCIPEGAVAGRFGSDEFLVLLPGVGLQEAANVAEAIAKTLSTYGYSVPNGPFLPIPCHIGVAVAPEDGESVNALLGAANWNLSIAKRNDVTVGLATDSRREDRKFLSDESFAALDALVAAVDNKDSYTRRHSEEVADYSLWLAEELGCSQETLDLVRMAALLHDVGKIGVPTEILTKPGRLTDAEYDTMKRHPVIGSMLIGAFRGMGRILDGAKYHHERWDGTGYPEGLKGNDIPWLGRLIAVADAFSAMTTNRPYRKGLSVSEAVRRLEEAAGTQLDPYMVEAFVRALTRRGLYRVSVRDELRQRRAA